MGIRKISTSMQSEPLTEQTIQRRLNYFFASWRYNVDGLYVFEWESDKLIWTKSGYIYEFEIKVSRSDFRNDFKKKKEKHIILKGPTEEEAYMPSFYQSYEWNKQLYQSIEECKARIKPGDRHLIASHKRPNYFYYAVPEGMLQPEDVPDYAGLIWLLKDYRDVRCAYVIKKTAPALHKQKYKDQEFNLAEKFYFNWQSDRRLRKEAQRDYEEARQLLREELDSRGQDMTYPQLQSLYGHVRQERDDYSKKYFDVVRDQNIDRLIIRRLRAKLQEKDPSFDYQALERECEKTYGIQ